MVEGARSWLKDNATLVYFLIGQAIFIGGGAFSLTTYMTQLEARVSTLETRGSPHLNVVDSRLTVLESKTTDNKEAIDRIVGIMVKELHVSPTR